MDQALGCEEETVVDKSNTVPGWCQAAETESWRVHVMCSVKGGGLRQNQVTWGRGGESKVLSSVSGNWCPPQCLWPGNIRRHGGWAEGTDKGGTHTCSAAPAAEAEPQSSSNPALPSAHHPLPQPAALYQSWREIDAIKAATANLRYCWDPDNDIKICFSL